MTGAPSAGVRPLAAAASWPSSASASTAPLASTVSERTKTFKCATNNPARSGVLGNNGPIAQSPAERECDHVRDLAQLRKRVQETTMKFSTVVLPSVVSSITA